MIRSEMLKPKVAFLSPQHCFESDWEHFREAMRQDGLKFSINFDELDTTLRQVVRYGYTEGLHPWHQTLVPRRLKTIVSSGILVIWQKWQLMRFKMACRKKGEELEKVVPLSFAGSDICLAFYMLGLLLSTSTMAFVYEVSQDCVLSAGRMLVRVNAMVLNFVGRSIRRVVHFAFTCLRQYKIW